jgi:hypothetical protein
MGFRLPDLIVESVIRDGLQNVRRDTTIIDDVFEDLSQTWLSKKYGDKEINRIKDFVRNTEVKFVQAFAQVPVSLPCVSLQLLGDDEDRQLTHLDDFEEDKKTTFTDPSDIAATLILDAIAVDTYDSLAGILTLDAGTDLQNVTRNQLFVDASGNEFKILGVEESGSEPKIMIAAGSDPDVLGPCQVRSSIDYKQYEIRGTGDQVKLLLGVHTQDRLLTIYLYTLIKYILKSRTLDLVQRGFQLPTFSGSDFARNNNYTEPVFERFMTVGGMVQDSWNSNKVIPIEDVEITTTVQRATATNEQLGLSEQTVQVEDSSEQDDE